MAAFTLYGYFHMRVVGPPEGLCGILATFKSTKRYGPEEGFGSAEGFGTAEGSGLQPRSLVAL